jgi:hypothetical protein
VGTFFTPFHKGAGKGLIEGENAQKVGSFLIQNPPSF